MLVLRLRRKEKVTNEKENERNWEWIKKSNGLTRKWIEKKSNRKSDSWKKVIGGKGN